jgi:pentatricopeptide repeat protein
MPFHQLKQLQWRNLNRPRFCLLKHHATYQSYRCSYGSVNPSIPLIHSTILNAISLKMSYIQQQYSTLNILPIADEVDADAASVNSTILTYPFQKEETNQSEPTPLKGRGTRDRLGKSDGQLIVRRVQNICNELQYPLGSFAHQATYIQVKTLFHTVITHAHLMVRETYSYRVIRKQKQLKNRSYNEGHSVAGIVDIIQASFRLLARIYREPWKPTAQADEENVTPSSRFCKPKYTNLLFDTWKDAALHNAPVFSAVEVAQFLQQTYNQHQVRYDGATLNMILQVAIFQAPKHLAPFVVQHVWATLERPDQFPTPSMLRYSYNALVKSLAVSGYEDAAHKIYEVMEDMRIQRNVRPDVITYNILLRYIRQSSFHLEKFEFAWQMMRQLDSVSPDINTLFEAVRCYSNFEHVEQAEFYLQQMIDIVAAPPTNPIIDMTVTPNSPGDDDAPSLVPEQPSFVGKYFSDISLILRASQCILDIYLQLFMKNKSSTSRRSNVAEQTQRLFDKLNQNNVLVSWGAPTRTSFLSLLCT